MFVLYFMLWVIFNGRLTLEIATFGLIIAGIVLWFTCRYMGYSLKAERKLYGRVLLFVKYVALLVKEIIKANFSVIHLILTQKEEVQPVLVTFHTDLKTPVGKAFLANAITLTPGTITVTLEEDEYMVHCLDEDLTEGINDSTFQEYIRRLEE